jgi:hypothetical protein
MSNDSEIGLIGLSGDGTGNPNASVVLNLSDRSKELGIEILGSAGSSLSGYCPSCSERYASLGHFALSEGRLAYMAPARSVTILYECEP